MKNIFLLAVYGMFSFSAFSQPYSPLLDTTSNTWQYSWNVFPVRSASAPNCFYPLWSGAASWSYTTVYDTTVNGYLYKAIGIQNYGVPFIDCVAGYLREDTAAREVYFMDNQFGPEKLLYDFSMVPSNTINLTFLDSGGYFPNGNYFLDSIRTVQLMDGPHRVFFLHHTSIPFAPMLQWIEGVGHPGNLLYLVSGNMMGGFFSGWCWPPDLIFRNHSDLLTCSYHGNQKVYFDSCSHAFALANQGSGWFSYIDSCVYWNMGGSVEEIAGLTSIKAAPNPAGSNTLVLAEATANLEGDIRIRDLFGRPVGKPIHTTLVPGQNTIPIDTGNLEAGVYLIEFRTRNGATAARLAIAR